MRLYILRHAEAFDATPGERDVDRELTPKGHAQAATVAGAFSARRAPCEISPQVIRSSPAPRAWATAAAVAAALGLTVEREEGVSLRADLDDALRLIHDLASEFDAAMIVGHNPTLSELAYRLCATGDVRKAECVVVDWTPSEKTARELARFRG
jgi:phosphohistidine phosphatase